MISRRARVPQAPAAVTGATRQLAILVASITSMAPAPAAAQQPWTIDVGLFAQRAAFDEGTALSYGTAPGFGGHLGVFVLPGLSFEAGSSYTWTFPAEPPRVDVTWVPIRGRLVYHFGVTDDFHPLVGLGLVHNRYSGAVSGSDTGVSGLLGLKTYFSDRWAFRADMSVDVISTAFNEGSDVNGAPVRGHLNWSFTGGVSMDIGSGRYRDADGDAVHDRADLCPETPTGVSVDEAGCRLDEDADRVWDEDDLCPLTPPGVAVDAAGCRVDADRDGVFDEDDACPATPAGVTVGTTGCPIDTDRDRVPDHLDECTDTPLGVSVDAMGCRVDGDVDGVWDEDDLCPGTAAGTAVDPTGCAILFEEERAVLVLRGVNFGSWSSELNGEAMAVLNELADALIANPDVHIRVNGHTDSTGTRGENLRLSQERADAVMEYLIERGVTADRLEAQGFGPDMPIATNETAEGRQENRRVELERINPGD